MPTPEPNLHLTRAIHGAVISLEERAREYSLEQVLRATLDEAETLTGSCIGFYHFVAEDQENLHLQAWSTRTEAEFCRAEGKGLHYPISKAGVWADCLRTGHPLMHNDYPNLPNRQGLPPGHAAVLRELVVPVKRGGRVVAVLGVGNKATDYDAVDVETVQLLADLAWHLAAAKRMTRALEESLAKNQALVRAIPDLIFTNRRDGEYLDAHVSDPELLLVPPEAFLHRNVREVLPKALADQFVRAFEEALDSGMEQKLTYALQLEDAEKQFEGRVVPYSTDSVITIVRDITEETRAARALLQEKERLSRIFQASYDAIYVTDLHDGTYLEVNDAFERITGFSRAEAIGRNSMDLNLWIRPDDRLDYYRELQATSTVHNRLIHIRHKEGREVWAECNSSTLVSDGRQCMVSLARDVTEAKNQESQQRHLEAQLQHAQKMESLGVLAGGVAHDMNNVLGAILGLASANLEIQAPGSRAYTSFETIVKAATRGGEMVRSLLAFARHNQVEEQLLDVNAILREETQLLERTTLAKVCLELDLQPGLHPMRGDASALNHAFMNLCVNAVDAMPEQGTLTLRTRNVNKDWLEVVVEDTGTGMPKEVMDRAMEPFFTTKGVGKGTGLGLSMVYSTVKAHGGQIEIQSRPGLGTQVRLQLPACEPGPETAVLVAANEAETPRRSLKLLLVDDDELIQSSLGVVLQTLGHGVTIRSSGEEALTLIEAGFRPQVVILDMNMPGLGGAGTLPRLRALLPTVPVLLSTGRTDQAALDLSQAHPYVGLLPKPFSLKDIQGCLEALVRG